MFGNVTALVGLHVTGVHLGVLVGPHAGGALQGVAEVEEHNHRLPQHDHLQRLGLMCSGSEAGSYLRLIDFCITQL